MTTRKSDKEIENWAKEYREEHIDDKTQRLINLAWYDLHYGAPCDGSTHEPERDEFGNENEWSGYDFERACAQIKEALSDVPSAIYIDTDTGWWSTTEPNEYEDCLECDGKGEIDGVQCDACGGEGKVRNPTEYYKVERRTLIAALVGKELGEYVR